MSLFGGPLHLLFLDKPFTHHLVDRGFNKRGTDGVTLSVPLPEVGNKVAIVANIRLKLGDTAQQLGDSW